MATPFSFNLGEHLISPLAIVPHSPLTDFQTARDNDDAYALYQSFWERSDTHDPQSGFQDLYRSDFINAAGRVGRRKMDHLHDSSPYHHALVLRGLSKRQEEEEVKPELIQAMEYAGAISAQALEQAVDIDRRAIIAIEELNLSVVDLESRVQEVETRQGNLGGIQGAVAEAWGKVSNALDAADRMEVDVADIKERIEIPSLSTWRWMSGSSSWSGSWRTLVTTSQCW